MKRTRKRRRRPGVSPRVLAWVNSPAGRAAAKAAAQTSREARRRKARCGAKRKSDGRPCRNLPLANGRCRIHGGLSGSGDAWLVVQYPDPILQPDKYAKKVREIERRRQRQRERVARMTPEQRARHDAWHEAHKPGPRAARAMARRDREMRALLERPAPAAAPDPEAAGLQAALDEVRARRAELEALLATPNETHDEGVFQ